MRAVITTCSLGALALVGSQCADAEVPAQEPPFPVRDETARLQIGTDFEAEL